MRQLKIGQSYTTRGGAVDWYLRDIAALGRITPDEEVELSMRIQNGDESAVKKMVESNLRFVVSVAKQYQGHGLELTDLINEGNIGLIKAASRFDATRGNKFISYAVWWVRQQIIQAISEQSRMVRIPLNQVATLNKLTNIASSFVQDNGREPSALELSEITGIPESKVTETMCLFAKHTSLDRPLGEDDESGTLLDVKADEDSPAADSGTVQESLHDDILSALGILTQREREIILWSFGIGCSEMTMEEIGEKLDLTRERVRQVREKAVRKLAHSEVKSLLRQYL